MRVLFWFGPVSGLAVAFGLLVSFSQPLEPMVRLDTTVVYPNGLEVPTTWWRVGTVLGRSETPTDLMVYREPEAWLVDPASGTGTHIVDPGPSYALHLPVASLRGDLHWPPRWLALEVGRERQFMADHGVQSRVVGQPQETHFVYEDPQDHVVADLQVDRDGIPACLVVRLADAPLVTLVYRSVQTGLTVDWSLFAPPEGIRFREVP